MKHLVIKVYGGVEVSGHLHSLAKLTAGEIAVSSYWIGPLVGCCREEKTPLPLLGTETQLSCSQSVTVLTELANTVHTNRRLLVLFLGYGCNPSDARPDGRVVVSDEWVRIGKEVTMA
jgi:hypothetical protein